MKKQIQKKPNIILYLIFGALLWCYCKIKYKLKSNKVVLPKEGALILANHQSSLDAFILMASLFPQRLNTVAAYYFFMGKPLRFFLKFMGSIPKYQFSSDYNCTKKMVSVIKNNGYLALMPEGTVPMTGKMEYLAPSIASLIKLLKVDVYSCNIEGSSLVFPKWAKHNKSGKVTATTQLLFKKEELRSLTNEQILEKLHVALAYDDFKFAKENNLTFKGKAKAEGLENLIHICPHCLNQGSIKTKGDKIYCSHCGLEAELDNKMQLNFNGEKYFENFNQWYVFQENIYKKEVSKDDFCLKDTVKFLSDVKNNSSYECLGNGELVLNKEGFTYKDEKRELFYPIEKVPMVVIDTGKNFELPYDNGIICFEPTDKTKIMKWYGTARILFDLKYDENKNR